MRFDVAGLSPEELVVLIVEAKRALYPEAVIIVMSSNAQHVTNVGPRR